MSKWRTFKRNLFPKIGPLVYFFARAIGMTQKIKPTGWERYEKGDSTVIFAGWHGCTFLFATFLRNKKLFAIISNSKDGELQNYIFRKFGFETIRGSSGRDGVKALIEAIKTLRGGKSMAFTPDGPRGPSGVVQEGIMTMAQKSGAKIVPVGSSARNRWRAKSWDRYMIPKPFSSAVVVFGDPIEVPPDATKEEVEQLRLKVEAAIHRMAAEAERLVGRESESA